MKRFLAMMFGIFAFIALAVVGAVLVMPEEDLASLIRPLPVVGSHTDSIVGFKQEVGDAASHMVEDTLYSISSTWRDITDFSLTDQTQRVVIELEPVRTRKPKEPSAPPASTAPSPMAPQPLTPQPAPSSMSPTPMTPEPPPMPVMENATPPAEMAPVEAGSPPVEAPPQPPEMASTGTMTEASDKPAAPEAVSEASPQATPETEPATTPAEAAQPADTANATMAETKTAALPKPARKPPPPAPTVDNGSEEHKKGLTYYKGIGGVAKNFKTAAQWFRQSSAKGNAASQYNLGIMAYLGQGEEQSFADAAKWFQQAANQDHALAQYNLGFLYYEGKGVEKDDLQAFMWIDRAARLGDEKAIKARDTLEKILPEDILKGR